MKKLLGILLLVSSAALANVTQTTVGCEQQHELTNFLNALKANKNQPIEKLYKAAIENGCEFIEPNDDIKLIGTPNSEGTALVYVKRYDRNFYIQSNVLGNINSTENHKLMKKF